MRRAGGCGASTRCGSRTPFQTAAKRSWCSGWTSKGPRPQFMAQSIQQRREAIADDCWQLKQDLDSYNQYHNPAEPLQVVLDFSEDVEEREAARASSPPQ